jgi:hypothetical protein
MTSTPLNIEVAHPRVQGIFQLTVKDADGNVVREYPEFTNLITNVGLDEMINLNSLSAIRDYAKVGTGVTAPAAGDTTLPGFVVSTTSATAYTGTNNTATAPYYYEIVTVYQFVLGAVVGTMGCVGVAHATGALVDAWSQIKDGANNPTTITILAGEQLQVTYRLRYYAPGTSAGSVTLEGINYPYTVYPHDFGSSWWTTTWTNLMPVAGSNECRVINWTTMTPPATAVASFAYTGKTTANINSALGPYGAGEAGTFTRTLTLSATTAVANLAGGFRGIELTGTFGPLYTVIFASAIPKDATKTLSIIFSNVVARYP